MNEVEKCLSYFYQKCHGHGVEMGFWLWKKSVDFATVKQKVAVQENT